MSSSSAENFRANLKAKLAEPDFTVGLVAERTGLKESNVYAYRNGDREPGLTMLDKFARALEVEAWELIQPVSEKIPS